jgi:choloylglycine hydrolase
VLERGTNVYFGRNLDWSWENGLVIINQRNIEKLSLVPPATAAAHWTSRYGSVTFNQFGQEMPFGGMNETGLVVECTWMNETQYATADSRPSINLLQWIQYQLDNCQNVDEVLATDAGLRIYAPNGSARVHYFVCDSKGECASIEILGGRMVVHRDSKLPFRALANDSYQASVECVHDHPEIENLRDQSSRWRFSHAATRADAFRLGTSQENLHYTFTTLDEVAQGSFTVWSIVYDVSNRQIYYHTRKNQEMRSINLKNADFSTPSPARFVDIETGVLAFHELSEETQRNYLSNFFADPALKQKLGDLMPQLDAQLRMLREFRSTTPERNR